MAVLSATSASRAVSEYSPNCEVCFDAQGGLLVASVRATRSIASGERLQLHDPEEEEEEWEDDGDGDGSEDDGEVANEGESVEESDDSEQEEEGHGPRNESGPHSKRPRF